MPESSPSNKLNNAELAEEATNIETAEDWETRIAHQRAARKNLAQGRWCDSNCSDGCDIGCGG